MNFSRLLVPVVVGFTMLTLVTSAQAEDVTLNLKDADINALITTVSEVTGKNFIIDPRVKGKVTVLSSRPMTPDAVYETFLTILQVHGYAAIDSGAVIKIVPEVGAKQDGGTDFTSLRNRVPDDEIVTRVMLIDNVPAAQLVPILRPLVPQYGHLAAYAPSNMLILADRRANVDRLSEIIRRIDKGGDREIEFIPLEYASASEVVRIVTGITQGQDKATATPSSTTVIADERTNSIIVGGDRSQRLQLRSLIAQLDVPLKDEGDTQVIYLKYASAEKLAPILEGYVQQASSAQEGGAKSQSSSSQNRIIAEPDINALVITAPPKVMRGLRNVIKKLDIRRAQVMVEAIIAEVSVNRSRALGIDSAVFNQEEIAYANILDQGTLQSLAGVVAGNPFSLVGQGLTLAGGANSSTGTSFAFLLKALSSDGDTNILSTPTLVTMDNEEAKISVGAEVPFLTGSFSSTGNNNGTVNPFQTIERRDVGLTLGITPQVNEGDTVQLKISQEVSDIAAGVAGAQDLVTNKRTLETTVMVRDSEILVLGGLIDEKLLETESRTPFLGRIPIIGALFRSNNVTKTKQNLLIFIRPVIIRDDRSASYYSKLKYEQIRNLQLQARQRRIPLMGEDKQPLIVKFDEYKRHSDAPQTTAPAVDQYQAARTGYNRRGATSREAAIEAIQTTAPSTLQHRSLRPPQPQPILEPTPISDANPPTSQSRVAPISTTTEPAESTVQPIGRLQVEWVDGQQPAATPAQITQQPVAPAVVQPPAAEPIRPVIINLEPTPPPAPQAPEANEAAEDAAAEQEEFLRRKRVRGHIR